MFYYDIRLSIFASAFTLLSSCILLWIIWRSIRIQLPLLESGAEITNFSLQSVMGLPQIRSAGLNLLFSYVGFERLVGFLCCNFVVVSTMILLNSFLL